MVGTPPTFPRAIPCIHPHPTSIAVQLVEAVLQEADLSRAAVADVTRERLEFEAAWGAWLGSQLSAGMAQPLPKGWVPQPDAVTGGVHFLNTRTGEDESNVRPDMFTLHNTKPVKSRYINLKNISLGIATLHDIYRAGVQLCMQSLTCDNRPTAPYNPCQWSCFVPAQASCMPSILPSNNSEGSLRSKGQLPRLPSLNER